MLQGKINSKFLQSIQTQQYKFWYPQMAWKVQRKVNKQRGLNGLSNFPKVFTGINSFENDRIFLSVF